MENERDLKELANMTVKVQTLQGGPACWRPREELQNEGGLLAELPLSPRTVVSFCELTG